MSTLTTGAAAALGTAAEVIEEDCLPFTRLGLRLNQPVAAGKITMTFRPSV